MKPFSRAMVAALLCTSCLIPGIALAQADADTYPTRPIKLVVPWAVGGATDSLARLIGQKLSTRLKQPVVVENRSGGTGSSQHLSSSLLKKVADIDIVHVPYKGSGPALSDLMAGQVDFILDTGSLGHVQGGTLKALAVAAAKRIPALPDVPTFAELGYADMIASAWYGVLAPANLPRPIQDRLNAEVNVVLKDPETRERIEMTLGGLVSDGESPAWFGDFIKTELTRYAGIIEISGAKAK